MWFYSIILSAVFNTLRILLYCSLLTCLNDDKINVIPLKKIIMCTLAEAKTGPVEQVMSSEQSGSIKAV